MSFEEAIKSLPVWSQVLLILLSLPSVVSVIALVRSWGTNINKTKLQVLENQYAQIMSERDERLSNTAMVEKMLTGVAESNRQIFELYTAKLNDISNAIRDAATINNENDTANREALENNTKVMSDFRGVMRGIATRWESVDAGLREVAAVSKQVIEISTELNNKSVALHSDVRQQLEFFESVRSTLSILKTDIQKTAQKDDLVRLADNFGEIYDDLEQAIQQLSLIIQRRTDTQPLPDEVLEQLEDIDETDIMVE